MSQLVLDAGAFIAFERGNSELRALLRAAQRSGHDVVTSTPIVAHVWRGGRGQALLAMLLKATRIVAPDQQDAKRAGALLAKSKTSDVVDALLVGVARGGDIILTSDLDDIDCLVRAARLHAKIRQV